MQQQSWALVLIFPNKSLTCNSSKCTHTSFWHQALHGTYSISLSVLHTLSLTLPPFSYHFLLFSPHHLPYFPLCFSVSAPFSIHPYGCFPVSPAVLLHHSVYMNLGLTHCLLACLLWYVLETENRIELCWACSTAPIPWEMEDILHWVNLLLFRQADFYFGLCRFPLLRQFYCIIRRQGQQWSGLTVWARPVSPPSSSLCVCVALCLSGFLTACFNLSSMPATVIPPQQSFVSTHWEFSRLRMDEG